MVYFSMSKWHIRSDSHTAVRGRASLPALHALSRPESGDRRRSNKRRPVLLQKRVYDKWLRPLSRQVDFYWAREPYLWFYWFAVSECPDLKPPKYGSFVREKCPRVFNAACGVTCETGRQLIGSSIRLCRANGTWSGKSPVCRSIYKKLKSKLILIFVLNNLEKRCPELKAPPNGWVRCNGESEVDARCEIGCDEGYIVLGSKMRNCLAIGMWDGLPTSCRGKYLNF